MRYNSNQKYGYKKDKLPLSVRVYQWGNCDWIANRDYSANLNLLGLAEPDVMPVEMKTPKSIDEAGTKNQAMSNIV